MRPGRRPGHLDVASPRCWGLWYDVGVIDRSEPVAQRQIRHVAAPGLPPEVLDGPRRRILEASLLLFARKGFHGTSVRDIAEALGQRPSALYKHFVGKEQILAELVHLGFALHHQRLLDALVNASPSATDQLMALVGANARAHAHFPLLSVVVNEELHALPEGHYAAVMGLRLASVSLLQRVLERGVAEDGFDIDDAATTMAAISAMGIRIPFWFRDPDIDVDALAARQQVLALRLVGRPPPKGTSPRPLPSV